jgi:hypothetical protein
VIRWPAVSAGVADAGAGDGGGGDAGAPERPGIVDVIPGVSFELSHEALYVRSAADAYVAAMEPAGRPAPVSRLFHFDGTTWGPEALPAGATVVRGLSGTADGTLWTVSDRAVWKRAPASNWEAVPLPGGPAGWEMLDVRVIGDADVWIAARHGGRDVVLRTRPAATVVRWE